MERKDAAVQFLYSLASSQQSKASGSPSLPSLVPPRTTRVSSSPSPVPDESAAPRRQTGKSKADIVRKYRAKMGHPQLSEEALLRDALYILQGISGKFVRLIEGDGRNPESRLLFSDDPVSLLLSGEIYDSHLSSNTLSQLQIAP